MKHPGSEWTNKAFFFVSSPNATEHQNVFSRNCLWVLRKPGSPLVACLQRKVVQEFNTGQLVFTPLYSKRLELGAEEVSCSGFSLGSAGLAEGAQRALDIQHYICQVRPLWPDHGGASLSDIKYSLFEEIPKYLVATWEHMLTLWRKVAQKGLCKCFFFLLFFINGVLDPPRMRNPSSGDAIPLPVYVCIS